MEPTPFIVKERTATANDRLVLLGRLVMTMRLFRFLLPLSLLLLVGGLLLPQGYLWITGQLSSCRTLPCTVTLPYNYGQLEITLGLLAKLFGLSVLVQLLSWMVFELSAQWSVLPLHDRMMQKIARVRTTFFDEHPSGRILNRLVRDFDTLTQHVTVRFSDTLYFSLSIMLSVVLAWLVQPLLLLLTIPVLGLVLFVQWQIAMMNERVIAERSAALSTVLHRETDLIEGGRVFALYDALPTLIKRLCRAADRYVHYHLWQIVIERYGRSLTGILRVLFTGSVMLVTVYSLKTGRVSEALALVLLSQLPPLQSKFSSLAWSWLNAVQSFATVRRIFEYVDLDVEEKSESGTPFTSGGHVQLTGDIEFANYSMSYRPHLPNILDGLSVKIPAGKRVGLVGRTGSGKTSILQALFRMVFVKGGDITIGSTSIFSMPIDSVRDHFVVVPQEPYLFAGTLRDNIDYKKIADDVKILEILGKVGIDLPLDTVLLEGGENLSLGERQLLCLARALIVDAPYVIMDEPTSSVDSITDVKMQNIIRNEFNGRTILTVAHRLETLKEYDWIIELEQGKVLIAGSPEEFFRFAQSSSEIKAVTE